MPFRGLISSTTWFLSARVFSSFKYRARHGLHRGLMVVGGLGFIPFNSLSAEERYLFALDLTDKVVYDVGAFIGLRTLFFATRARHVISYEPNSENRRRLNRNLEANSFVSKVTVRPVGVGNCKGSMNVLWDDRRAGECVAESSPGGRLLLESGTPFRRETVSITTLDEDVRTYAWPDFIKIDVEGLELAVLQGADRTLREHAPDLFIELHGTTLENKVKNAEDVLGLLFNRGYQVYDVELGKTIKPGETFKQAPSHIHCVPGQPRTGKKG
jgi:FkbM family methyltransferase